MTLSASVVVPTHNRPDRIETTLHRLLEASSGGNFEIVVVDDGSDPPFSTTHRGVSVVRTAGIERSRARNAGALVVKGDLLIFLDDDIAVSPDFVKQHVDAALEFGNVICVGPIRLSTDIRSSPCGRFRQLIEDPGQARPGGFVNEANFCTAANMSIRRDAFLSLGGFDPAILSGEDQDLALRFSAKGGRIAYVPGASVIHRDSNGDMAAYCRRHEWGARAMAPLLRRYPEREDSKQRLRFEQGHLTRRALSRPLVTEALLRTIEAMERAGAGDRVLFPIYRIALGLHLFRGFREGLAAVTSAPPLPGLLEAVNA